VRGTDRLGPLIAAASRSTAVAVAAAGGVDAIRSLARIPSTRRGSFTRIGSLFFLCQSVQAKQHKLQNAQETSSSSSSSSAYRTHQDEPTQTKQQCIRFMNGFALSLSSLSLSLLQLVPYASHKRKRHQLLDILHPADTLVRIRFSRMRKSTYQSVHVCVCVCVCVVEDASSTLLGIARTKSHTTGERCTSQRS
jgi:hypothetical protein